MKKKGQKHTRTKREIAPEVVETKDFTAVVVERHDGTKDLEWATPVWFRHQIGKFKTGEKVSVYVSSRRPKRTLQQNRYLFGVYYPLIARETGEHNIDRLHKFFAGKFLTQGIVEVFGQKVRMVKSSTELSKSEFSEFIMNIEAETEIEAPPVKNYIDDYKGIGGTGK